MIISKSWQDQHYFHLKITPLKADLTLSETLVIINSFSLSLTYLSKVLSKNPRSYNQKKCSSKVYQKCYNAIHYF